jgi:hypothetical protein
MERYEANETVYYREDSNGPCQKRVCEKSKREAQELLKKSKMRYRFNSNSAVSLLGINQVQNIC